jgi:hypothetical protein
MSIPGWQTQFAKDWRYFSIADTFNYDEHCASYTMTMPYIGSPVLSPTA